MDEPLPSIEQWFVVRDRVIVDERLDLSLNLFEFACHSGWMNRHHPNLSPPQQMKRMETATGFTWKSQST